MTQCYEVGFYLGQAIRRIDDSGLAGKPYLPMDQIRRFPRVWLRTNKDFIRFLRLPLSGIETAVESAEKIVHLDDEDAKDRFGAALAIGYWVPQKTFN